MSEKDLARFIDYKPNLKYEKPIEPYVPKTEDTDNSSINPYSDLLDKYLTPDELGRYLPSIPVIDALEVSPTNILSGYHNLLEKITQINSEIIKSLRDKLANKPSVDDYIKARRDNDANIIYEFEDFHALHIEGDTSAEALAFLLDLQDEAEMLEELINQEFFDGQADIHRIEKMQQEEEENIRNMILNDAIGKTDIDRLAEDNYVKDFLQEKLWVLEDTVNQIQDIITDDLNHSYGGQAVEIMEALTEDLEILGDIAEMNKERFDEDAQNSEDARQRMGRLSSIEQKKGLLKRLRTIQKKKLKNRKLLTWMENKDLDGTEPINAFFLDILEGINKTTEQCEMLTEDLFGLAKMDELQLNDYTVSLRAKQNARNINNTANAVKQHINVKTGNKAQQTSNLLKHMGLDKEKFKEKNMDKGDMHSHTH